MTKGQAKRKSIMTGTCPRCLQSKMYIKSNPYNLAHISKMHERCSKCDLNYYPEPGYYFGAMYVTYALVVGQFCILYALKTILNYDISIFNFMLIFLAVLFILAPINFRLSRVVWLNFFVSYDEELANKAKNKK